MPNVNQTLVEQGVKLILQGVGADQTSDHLKETPARVARFWAEFIDYNPGRIETSFPTDTVIDQVVGVTVRVWSLCAHHLLPFSTDLTIAYIPRNRLVGLSKLARIAHKHAHKLQVQEELVAQIANEVQELSGSPDVAVYGRGKHLCMIMRGIRSEGEMFSSDLRGAFRDEGPARQEFFSLARKGQ